MVPCRRLILQGEKTNSMAKSKMEIIQEGAVTTIKTNGGIKILQTSDIHFDSFYCNRAQLFLDLQYAVANGIYVMIFGDIFDAMQGRFDPRRHMEDVRPEYRRENYYDLIVDDAIEQLNPYASNILLVSDGNHELSVLKNANTDLIGRLVKGLSSPKHTVYRGGYGGILRFIDDGFINPAKYFHGSGGEAPVTRGAIQTNRQAVFLPDYNMILNGHSHHQYIIPITRERVTPDGVQYFDFQWHLRSPGYNMSYGDGTKGWEVTRGGVPKPLGSVLIDIKKNEIRPTPWISVPIPVNPIIDIYDGIVFPQE